MENKDFCSIRMPLNENMILEFNQSLKLSNASSIIYAYPGSLIKNRCKNNPDKSLTTIVTK